MSDTPKKIVSEFSLLPEGKQRLEAFLIENLGDLQSFDDSTRNSAMQRLVNLLEGKGEHENNGVLPKYIIDELKKVFSGEDEIAYLIRNCPEHDDIKDIPKPSEQNSYGYYIGRAICEMCNVKHSRTDTLTRTEHRRPLAMPVEGFRIHRDMSTSYLDDPTDIYSKKPRGEYVIITCPYNGENSITEVIHLKQAIESLTEEQRQAITVKVRFNNSIEPESITLENLLTKLKPIKEQISACEPLLIQIEPSSLLAAPEFNAAILANSAARNLQPGDHLIFNENNMFHRANRGDPDSIKRIPATAQYSRVLHHLSGLSL